MKVKYSVKEYEFQAPEKYFNHANEVAQSKIKRFEGNWNNLEQKIALKFHLMLR